MVIEQLHKCDKDVTQTNKHKTAMQYCSHMTTDQLEHTWYQSTIIKLHISTHNGTANKSLNMHELSENN